MLHYETKSCKNFLTILRANPAYQTAITELNEWKLVEKVIQSLGNSYTEKQLDYIKKKDWLKSYVQATTIVLKMNQNRGMTVDEILTAIFDFKLPLNSETEKPRPILSGIINRHLDNSTSKEGQLEKYDEQKYFTIVDIDEVPRRFRLIDIK